MKEVKSRHETESEIELFLKEVMSGHEIESEAELCINIWGHSHWARSRQVTAGHEIDSFPCSFWIAVFHFAESWSSISFSLRPAKEVCERVFCCYALNSRTDGGILSRVYDLSRGQVTAEHTCTLRMWNCMKWGGVVHSCMHGVDTTRQDGSGFTDVSQAAM